MTVKLMKGLSKKGNEYYTLLIAEERFAKWLFITDIEASYLMSKGVKAETMGAKAE